MRTLKLTLAYDGTHFSGWQIQKHRRRKAEGGRRKGQKPTIQGTLEDALSTILRERVRVIGSGRTDAGVHALGQVAHLCTHSTMPIARLHRAFNGVLPPEIVVTHLEEAPDRFHAQHHARSKRYRYQMVTGAYVLPFERPYVHHVRVVLNVALMRREARALIGRHDFKSFQKQGGRPPTDTRRTITAVRFTRTGPAPSAAPRAGWPADSRPGRGGAGRQLIFEIEGNGFLYGMVRRIMGTLLNVGRGHRPPGTVAKILKIGKSGLVGPSAPARGLCLMQVDY